MQPVEGLREPRDQVAWLQPQELPLECSWLAERGTPPGCDSGVPCLPGSVHHGLGQVMDGYVMYKVEQAQQERNHPTLLAIPPPVETAGYEGGREVQPGPIHKE